MGPGTRARRAGDAQLLAADRAARADLAAAVDELHSAQLAAGTRRPLARRWWALTTIIVVAALVLAVWAVVSWWRDDDFDDADYERVAAERVSLLLAPDFRDPQQTRRILSGATGAFRDEFAQSADAYTQFVRSNGTVARSWVDGTGVSGRVGDTATVLVAASVVFDGRPQSAESSEVLRRFRLRVLLTPDAGELKLGAVQYLP
ncbi:hypothetical protein QSJ18_14120 [Gordonia sp. ABSL1-1]|uniref:hypothetical protein n=1 Tax=Gordonia sp. ABSL1-1 TaxID=3053923 RepID=UPI00257332A3|nr:hypothetical protein [Gordonia sp. ABSL1-1]MDL9937886.1 hypothetical protein [Gordonia sp. ABSL1-1]